MDWIRAKNIIIFTLIIINLLLRGLIFYSKGEEYNLNKKQVDSISKVLISNDIKLDAKVIETYEPRKKIILSKYKFDNDSISKVFFDEDVEPIQQQKDIVYQNESKTKSLVIRTNGFTFMTSELTVKDELDSSKSQKLCEDIIKKLGSEFKNFKLDRVYTFDENNVRFYFKEIFKGEVIDSNFIMFEVLNNNISIIELTYLKPLGFDDLPPKEIVPCDEVLLLINQEKEQIKEAYKIKDKVVIKDIKLVYDYPEKNINDLDNVYAVPIYCVYIEYNEDPMRIDAYNMKLM